MTEKNQFGQILGTAIPNWTTREEPSKKVLPGKYCTLEILNIDVIVMADPDSLFYAIIDNKTQLPSGFAAYLRMNPPHGIIEVGQIHSSSTLQKIPTATEAMFLMMQYIVVTFKFSGFQSCCHCEER